MRRGRAPPPGGRGPGFGEAFGGNCFGERERYRSRHKPLLSSCQKTEKTSEQDNVSSDKSLRVRKPQARAYVVQALASVGVFVLSDWGQCCNLASRQALDG